MKFPRAERYEIQIERFQKFPAQRLKQTHRNLHHCEFSEHWEKEI